MQSIAFYTDGRTVELDMPAMGRLSIVRLGPTNPRLFVLRDIIGGVQCLWEQEQYRESLTPRREGLG